MEASTRPHDTMAHCLSVSLLLPLVVATLLLPVTGSSIGRTMNKPAGPLENPEYKFGYQGNRVYPGDVVYIVGGYYPEGSAYYPASSDDGQPGSAGGYPVHTETDVNPGECEDECPVASEEGGKISGGVPVNDEVEVFNVPQSNQGGYPDRRQPDEGYPSLYPNGGYPGLYPHGWYPGVYSGGVYPVVYTG